MYFRRNRQITDILWRYSLYSEFFSIPYTPSSIVETFSSQLMKTRPTDTGWILFICSSMLNRTDRINNTLGQFWGNKCSKLLSIWDLLFFGGPWRCTLPIQVVWSCDESVLQKVRVEYHQSWHSCFVWDTDLNSWLIWGPNTFARRFWSLSLVWAVISMWFDSSSFAKANDVSLVWNLL